MSASVHAPREQVFARLTAEAARLRRSRLTDLFAADPDRAAAFTMKAAGLMVDLSKQRLDAGLVSAFADLAAAADFDGWRTKLFAGERVNVTEKRAAEHPALRAPNPRADIAEAQARMAAFAKSLTGVNAIVHLGIGGSDLGPRLVYDALRPHRRLDIDVRFAANIDGDDIADALYGLDPAKTLVIVVSKTFTTLETIWNGNHARAWLGEHAKGRLAAVTAAPDKAAAWGVDPSAIFPFWDSIGGRYSVWSAVSLVLEIALRDNCLAGMRKGAAEMDRYFAQTQFAQNAVALSACAQMANRELYGCASYALIPYVHRLRLLPAYMQQLEMESNGKRVDRDGRALARPSAGVTWGEPGTVAQHSFFQLLHQGVEEIPVEILFTAGGSTGPTWHHTPLLANALAQARALMVGKTEDQAKAEMIAAGVAPDEAARLAPHRAFPGDRPSTIMCLDDLSPPGLGALLAFYEHRTFTQAVLSGINPFDQYGVELGKEMATQLMPALEGKDWPKDLDGSTARWLNRFTP